MRGADERQPILFSYRSIEDRIPADHPLRAMRRLVDPLLAELSPRFAALYATTGRPSIAPEHLLRALLLQVLYTIRSERQLMEQLDYNLLYRWFVGLTPDDAVWVPTVFTKNRDRLLAGNIAEAFFNAVLGVANQHALLSHEHFTVDGTLLEAWASHKSFRPKEDPTEVASSRARDGQLDLRLHQCGVQLGPIAITHSRCGGMSRGDRGAVGLGEHRRRGRGRHDAVPSHTSDDRFPLHAPFFSNLLGRSDLT
jgi:transposase